MAYNIVRYGNHGATDIDNRMGLLRISMIIMTE